MREKGEGYAVLVMQVTRVREIRGCVGRVAR